MLTFTFPSTGIGVGLTVLLFIQLELTENVLSLQKHFIPRYHRLRQYNVDPAFVSVSGLSNGAAFAMHMSFVYSSLISGVGVFAGVAYPVSHLVYTNQSTNLFKIQYVYSDIDKWSRAGLIDDVANLRRTRAYVWQGLLDPFPKYFMYDVVKEFKHYGADLRTSLHKVNAGHCMPTDNYPPSGDYWSIAGSTIIVCNANFQGVNHMFHHFYKSDFVLPRVNNGTPTGFLFKFDQNEFYEKDNAEQGFLNGMASGAFAYVPAACQLTHNQYQYRQPCKLHLVFHPWGYAFWTRLLSDGYNGMVHKAGYLQAADANSVILLYPEAHPLSVVSWDIWGASGKSYVWKNGTQPLAIAKMIRRVVYGE